MRKLRLTVTAVAFTLAAFTPLVGQEARVYVSEDPAGQEVHSLVGCVRNASLDEVCFFSIYVGDSVADAQHFTVWSMAPSHMDGTATCLVSVEVVAQGGALASPDAPDPTRLIGAPFCYELTNDKERLLDVGGGEWYLRDRLVEQQFLNAVFGGRLYQRG